METKCKGCQTSLANAKHRKVGEWLFCLDCFDKLLDKSREKSGSKSDEPWTEMETAVEVHVEKSRCHACGKEIEGANFKIHEDWKYCLSCYADMMPDKTPEFAYKADRVCKGCGKRVMEGGYNTLGDDPFCPDCYHAIVDIVQEFQVFEESQSAAEAQPVSATPGSQKKPTPAPDSTHDFKCQSCMNQVPEDALKRVDGFSICQACLGTDADSALEIARARHKKHLERLRRELSDG